MVKHYLATKLAIVTTIALLAVTVLLLPPPPPPETIAPVTFRNKLREATLIIFMGNGLGSGVVISKSMAVTAMHVCYRKNIQAVVDYKRTAHRIEKYIFDLSPASDVCLIKGDFSSLQPISLSDIDTESGDEVTFAGFPHGLFALKRGNIQSIEQVQLPIAVNIAEKKTELIKISVGCRPGTSGGPVVNSKLQLVGIVTAYDDYGSSCLLTPVSLIKAFIVQAYKGGF